MSDSSDSGCLLPLLDMVVIFFLILWIGASCGDATMEEGFYEVVFKFGQVFRMVADVFMAGFGGGG